MEVTPNFTQYCCQLSQIDQIFIQRNNDDEEILLID